MPARLALAMSSSFFTPSFAFSSHLDPDGAPPSELSWSSSLAVVAVSCSGLFTVIVLMLACLCCKKGGIGFKEFENAEGDERVADLSAQGSPAAAHGPDVYVLPLTEVSLPMAKQPGRSVQLLKSADLGRHSLLYLKEIGHGWFGKVFLGEVNSGASGTQVVVKELKSSASVQEQMQFLEEAQPYRTVQHSNLLQCLAQCAEVTPYLLVMESCPLGDLKGYLRSCRATESVVPDALTLQRMACEVACGTLHLHRHSFVHSDLALRNCLLTADLGVKVGDYGLAHCRYREDYFVTTDRLWVPLRWIAPELVDEVHGNLLVADQTKAGNVWSLGVTLWELFELGLQPYPQHSDRQVLAYAVREQQLKLPKPQLQLPLSDRWYEVMQLCWLQPDQRPTAEEVHLLLSYLCAKGTTEAEEEFELRWRSLRPRGGVGSSIAGCSAAELAAASSFPLLEQFSGDGFHGDGGDDVLTVTETSHGLNFEYKWEAGPGEAFPQPGDLPSAGPAARLQELSALDSAPRGVGVGVGVGVVPVLSARSPSLGSEYFIRLEEAAPAGHAPDCAGCAPSSRDDDSRSAALARATEPLLGQAPPSDGLWGHSDCHPPRRPRSPPPPMLAEQGAEGAHLGEAAFCPPMEDPLGASPLGSSGGRLSPAEEELGEAESGRAAQHPHWSSNASANNNSGSRHPESWDPHYFRNYDCPRPMQASGISPESSHLLAPEDPGAPLGGLQVASPAQEPGGCLGLPLGCPTQVLAPAACLVTPPWTQAALSGGDESQAEPRLAAEAEHPTGPQLPIPSALSPVQEGAPLPSAEAGAPDILPASPMPAAGSRAGATGPAQTPDGGGCSPEPEGSSSEDGDTTQATSHVFTDLSGDNPQAEGLGAGPAFRALQEQVRTPDCLDSLDIPSTASDGGSEVFSPSADCTSAGQPRALDSGYDTENYESPEFVLKDTHEPCEPEGCGELASEGESPGPETRPCVSLGGLSEKNPYRDSAYFSDLDAEVELPAAPGTCAGGRASGPELQPQSLQSRGPQSVQAGLGHEAPGEAWGAGPQELLLALLPPEASTPTQRAGPASPRPEPPRARDPAEMPPAPGPGPSHFSLLTPVALSSEGDHSGLQEAPGLSSEPAPQEQSGGPGTARDPVCLTLPGLPTALVGRPEGEGEDSEDSEESDEELRCYSVQEPSEGSEEEAPVVPVVVESQRARSLRGLLKVPSLLSQAFCADLERKKKAVSFFDDVTVYLFDQESPTRELGEPFPGAKESPPTFLAGSPGSPSALSRPRRAASSPSSSVGEEGGGFEWDDDFPLMPAKAAFATVLDPASPSLATAPKPAAPFSRFTVSPTPASRFSVTHVSDSDAELAGGSASPRSVCEEV